MPLRRRARSLLLRAELGCLAGLRGEREEALRLAAEIEQAPGRNYYGLRQTLQGWIAAHLGELDRAVELLADGGDYREYRVHYHVFLDPLLGYPPYELLIRPRESGDGIPVSR